MSVCRALRGVVLAAVEQLQEMPGVNASSESPSCAAGASIDADMDASSVQPPLAEQHAWLRENRRDHASLMGEHGMVAWLNVNRGENANKMHIHDPTRLSAVYFVSEGGMGGKGGGKGCGEGGGESSGESGGESSGESDK